MKEKIFDLPCFDRCKSFYGKAQVIEQANGEKLLRSYESDEHKATYKTVTSSRIDTAAFKKAFPSMAEQFTKTTTSQRFTFN